VKLLEETIKQIEDQVEKKAGEEARKQARSRLECLTMPFWAMGRVMDLAEDLAEMTGTMPPPIERKTVVTMAGDHGVTSEGTSKYPAEVTVQMVHNFVAGGAGINALAKLAGAKVVVVDMGVNGDLSSLEGSDVFVSRKIGKGTANMAAGPAMSRKQAIKCVETGISLTKDLAGSTDVFGTGDMGIGNTTPSSAIVATLSGAPVEKVTGRGTGLDDNGLIRKVAVIEKALSVNKPDPTDGLDILTKVGGFEIGGIAGLILGAASQRKPVLVDGFISTAGALIAASICPASKHFMISAHKSAEPGHEIALSYLGLKPLLALDMRLGEGTGSALAMHIVDGAHRILTEVATFGEAGVSEAE
jgi:nicotinate-nucleotide--dimethylbenzimidazole phosphoribosyltransferase